MYLTFRNATIVGLSALFPIILLAQEDCEPNEVFLESASIETSECAVIQAPEHSVISGIYSNAEDDAHPMGELMDSGTSVSIIAGPACGPPFVGTTLLSASDEAGFPIALDSYSITFEECTQTCCEPGYVVTSIFGYGTNDSRLNGLSAGGQCVTATSGDGCGGELVGAICTRSEELALVSRGIYGEECQNHCCSEGEVVTGVFSEAIDDSFIRALSDGGRCADASGGLNCNGTSIGLICTGVEQ